MHRHVEPITAVILEHQKFAALTTDLHDLQSDVAADAVFLMNDWGACRERLQITQNGIRVRGDFAPASFLSSALTKELRLGEDGQRRRIECETGELWRDRDRKRSVALEKCLPAIDELRAQ